MGRPRKEDHDIIDDTVVEAVNKKEPLKACPKCDSKATGAYKDPNGLWRCACSDSRCGFWDSQVYYSPEAAERGWNQAGGPSRREDW